MNKLTENLNIIQNLSNQPTENAEELKRKFDEAGNIIKNYLNDVVEPVVTQIEGDYVKGGDFNKYKKEIKDVIDEFDTKLQQTAQELSNSIGLSTSYGDFEITTHSVELVTNIQYGRVEVQPTFQKEGYIALGIVGYSFPYDYYQQWNIEQYKIAKREIGSCTVKLAGNAGTAEGNKRYSVTVGLEILWLKVKQSTETTDETA